MSILPEANVNIHAPDDTEPACAAVAGPARRRLSIAALRLVGLGLVSIGLGAGCALPSSARVPDGLDYGTSRLSERGAFRVSYRSDVGAVPLNRLHTWTLRVETADGRPISDTTTSTIPACLKPRACPATPAAPPARGR
jgi:hypothetical protein